MNTKLLTLLLCLMCSIRLWALDNVSYVDASGNRQTANNVTVITNSTQRVIWTSGWYVVTGEVNFTNGAECSGAVHLILADGAKLTTRASGPDYNGNIRVSGDGNSLTIYGQEGQTGELTARGAQFYAGIGGGSHESGSNITINGGIVKAYGGNRSAAIGGGDGGSGFNITINGGTVIADALGTGGAGIGGGNRGEGRDITINGGTITASGGTYAAGIGSGQNASASNIRINGGTVMAEGGDNEGDGYCTGIGCGLDGSATGVYVSEGLLVMAGDEAEPTNVIQHTSTTDIASQLVGKHYVTVAANDPFTITLDMQGGSNGSESVSATYGAPMPAITIPTRENDTFLGYYSEPYGGGY